MNLIRFKAQNHRQQVAARGALDKVDDRRTPRDLFDRLSTEFGPFGIDLAASADNALCPDFYTVADDALTQPWPGRAWLNPPFATLEPWLAKAWEEWNARRLETLVMLLPANRVEQGFWQRHVEPRRDRPGSPLRTRFLPGRLRFDMPKEWQVPDKGNRPPFGIAVLTWTGNQ